MNDVLQYTKKEYRDIIIRGRHTLLSCTVDKASICVSGEYRLRLFSKPWVYNDVKWLSQTDNIVECNHTGHMILNVDIHVTEHKADIIVLILKE